MINIRLYNKKTNKIVSAKDLTPLATELKGLFIPDDPDIIPLVVFNLRDVDGNLICEGDILSRRGCSNQVVEYNDYGFFISPLQPGRHKRLASLDAYSNPEEWKIIGNIYQNLELLEEIEV